MYFVLSFVPHSIFLLRYGTVRGRRRLPLTHCPCTFPQTCPRHTDLLLGSCFPVPRSFKPLRNVIVDLALLQVFGGAVLTQCVLVWFFVLVIVGFGFLGQQSTASTSSSFKLVENHPTTKCALPLWGCKVRELVPWIGNSMPKVVAEIQPRRGNLLSVVPFCGYY